MSSFQPITPQYLAPIGVMPVIVLDSVSHAVPVAEALYAGGIKAVEVTLRTPAALDSIKAIKKACPHIIVGAGTIVNELNLEQVAEAEVDFAVSPGMTVSLVKKAEALGVKLLPGVATCSEILLGMELGLSCLNCSPPLQWAACPY